MFTSNNINYSTKFKGFKYQLDALCSAKNLEYSAIFHEQGLGKTKIAIAERTAKTATTTTNSIRENPSSPGFLERALLALGLFKYACNGVIFKK